MVSNMTKIILVAGARPNFMKIAPIIRVLRQKYPEIDSRLIHTGQHYDRDMSEVFFKDLEIPQPVVNLGVGSGTHAEQTAKVMLGFEKICIEENPDLVLVVGDVNSTLACAIVAKKLNIQLAHVEAGLRSGDRNMPEEINRIVTDSISDLFFVTEKSGVENLIAEGKSKESIYFVGHVMIDNLFYQLEKLQGSIHQGLYSETLKAGVREYGVVTLHRPSNVDDPKQLAGLMETLIELSTELPLIFPAHPRTQENLRRSGIRIPSSIEIIPPQPYMEFLNLFKDARLVLTDSGGIQEETTALGISCLTLRTTTERPVTVTEGTNTIVGTSRPRILKEARKVLAGNAKKGKRPELWDGKAAERIVEALKEHCGGQAPSKREGATLTSRQDSAV
jgi:UDP-N-acetylglucosamine 2-epimerase (non-hydrolysing)